jgi:S1-C subfamily serine protease
MAVNEGRAGTTACRASTAIPVVIGDVITKADGKTVRHLAVLADLADQLEQVGVGKTIKLTVRRGNRDLSLDVPVVDVGQS